MMKKTKSQQKRITFQQAKALVSLINKLKKTQKLFIKKIRLDPDNKNIVMKTIKLEDSIIKYLRNQKYTGKYK